MSRASSKPSRLVISLGYALSGIALPLTAFLRWSSGSEVFGRATRDRSGTGAGYTQLAGVLTVFYLVTHVCYAISFAIDTDLLNPKDWDSIWLFVKALVSPIPLGLGVADIFVYLFWIVSLGVGARFVYEQELVKKEDRAVENFRGQSIGLALVRAAVDGGLLKSGHHLRSPAAIQGSYEPACVVLIGAVLLLFGLKTLTVYLWLVAASTAIIEHSIRRRTVRAIARRGSDVAARLKSKTVTERIEETQRGTADDFEDAS